MGRRAADRVRGFELSEIIRSRARPFLGIVNVWSDTRCKGMSVLLLMRTGYLQVFSSSSAYSPFG